MRPFRAGFALPGFFGSASRSPVAGYSNRNIITMINVLIVHYILPIRHPLHLVLSVKVTLSPRHCEDRTWQFDHWSRGKDTSAAASPHEARARAHKGPQLIAQGPQLIAQGPQLIALRTGNGIPRLRLIWPHFGLFWPPLAPQHIMPSTYAPAQGVTDFRGFLHIGHYGQTP